jgi:DNA-binding response OmpR family regulator
MKILYVENHHVFAETVISEFLSEHEVTVVPSLAGARRVFTTQKYNLVLVDYDLDDGKGVELVKEIRALNEKFPIIGVSSHQQGNEDMLRAGASAICSKMEFDQIQEILETVL